MSPRLISLFGLFVMIGLAWLMSSHKRRFPHRILVGGLVLQFCLAAIILKTDLGRAAFDAAGMVFTALVGCVDAGSKFVFGDGFGEHYFAFKVLPTIIFFSAFMSIFYYYGIMQRVVSLFALVMQKTLGTSGAETLSAAANIFVGQTEAPLVIRPYISSMTISELNAVMVGGFATMAGGVLAAFVDLGIAPEHLLAASVIAAPAALLIAKVMQPEIDTPKTLGSVKIKVEEPASNVVEAVANGTTGGLKLALNVGAMLIVFLALIAVFNLVLGGIGGQVEAYFGNSINRFFGTEFRYSEWSLEMILGYLFAPLAWLMGIEWADCTKAGELLGLKMATNEFVAYSQLRELMWPSTEVLHNLRAQTVLSNAVCGSVNFGAIGGQELLALRPAVEEFAFTPRLRELLAPVSENVISLRSQTILTYALCGFANFSSIGIQLGGIGGIAPDRRGDLARLGLRAMLGGTLAAFMTACIAGVLL